jgi:hypothetical protein
MKHAAAGAGVALLLFGTASPEGARAQGEAAGPCRLELTGNTAIEWRGLYGRGYEVAGQEQEFETLPVTVRHEGAACEYFVVATPLSSGADSVLTGAGDQLTWDLRSAPSGPSLLSRDFAGSLSTQLAGRFEAETGAQPLSLFFTILPGQFVRGGHYHGDFVLRLFRSDEGGPELVSELPVSAIAAVPSILQVRSDDFPGGSREISVDLGDLNTPSARSIGFDIVSNTAVAVTFASAAGGVLAHQFGGPGVPYDLRLNGAPLSLAVPVRERLDMAAPDGSRAAVVEIAVPPTRDSLPAGRYSDTLTITFTADA